MACSSKRPLARVLNKLFDNKGAIEDSDFVWLPAHTSGADVGRLRRSDGQLLTASDRRFNAAVDLHAKLAAAQYAVDGQALGGLAVYMNEIVQSLKWLGIATYEATHQTTTALGDFSSNARHSDASRAAANPYRSRRANEAY